MPMWCWVWRAGRNFATWTPASSAGSGWCASRTGCCRPWGRSPCPHGVLARRQAAIKAVLLDQRVGAGVGNIYADEALFRARIHPERPAASLTLKECQTLCRTVRHVLRTGIAWRGSFISSYAPPSGVPGRFQTRHQVFRRTGEPCPHCRTTIERIRVGQRSTHYCPACQQVAA